MNLIELKSGKFIKEFHTYVRPTVEKNLTQYCSETTGITNEKVFGKKIPTLPDAVHMLH